MQVLDCLIYAFNCYVLLMGVSFVVCVFLLMNCRIALIDLHCLIHLWGCLLCYFLSTVWFGLFIPLCVDFRVVTFEFVCAVYSGYGVVLLSFAKFVGLLNGCVLLRLIVVLRRWVTVWLIIWVFICCLVSIVYLGCFCLTVLC